LAEALTKLNEDDDDDLDEDEYRKKRRGGDTNKDAIEKKEKTIIG
jgi:hypothetical protein